ncbi:MAG TPA: DUF222 domain-containing protein, partial [Kofleriaceae bacterium]|nr:DUF222 domain-containing protein [Kofleriaceae bacterium]
MEHGEATPSLSPTEIEALGDDIAVTAAHIDAATHRLLTLIREFDLAGGWHRQGALSCAHWLSWRIGLGLGPAREKVRVASRLAELPLLDEAFRLGELSYSKLRAMTRVASSDNEAALLDLARNSTAAQLERICRLYRQAHPHERTGSGDNDERRWVVARATDDGMVAIQIRLNPEEAARLMRAIEHCADRGSLADGAVALADSGLAGVSGAAGAEAGPIRPPVEVVVHVAAATLEGHTDRATGSPRRRAAASCVTPASCRWSRTTPARPSMSGARPGPSRPRCGGRSRPATIPAASRLRPPAPARRASRRSLDRRGRDESAVNPSVLPTPPRAARGGTAGRSTTIPATLRSRSGVTHNRENRAG